MTAAYLRRSYEKQFFLIVGLDGAHAGEPDMV